MTDLQAGLLGDLRRRAGAQGQPGLRVRRPLAARGRRRRRRRGPRRHRVQHRDPGDPQARRREPSEDLLAQVAGALHRAHDRIGELVEQDSSLNGTSTTAVVDPLRRPPARLRPHRRQPRLPRPRRHAAPADHRPHVRADPHRRRPHHRGGGAHPPAPQPHPQGDRQRARGRARPVPRRHRAGRPGAAVQRRRPLPHRRPDRRHHGHRHGRLRRRRAGPGRARGRLQRQRDLHRRRRGRGRARSRPTRHRCWSARPPTCPGAGAAASGWPAWPACFRGHRSGDTGELEPIQAEIPEGVGYAIDGRPRRPRGGPLRAAPAGALRLGPAPARRRRAGRPGLDGSRSGLGVEPAAVLRRVRHRTTTASTS